MAFSQERSRSTIACCAFDAAVTRGVVERDPAAEDFVPAAGALSPGARARKLWWDMHVEHSTRTGVPPTMAMTRWLRTSLHLVHQLSTSPPARSALLMA